MPNFINIGQLVANILRFLKMAAVRHLGFVSGTFGPYLGSISLQNLVMIDAVVLII